MVAVSAPIRIAVQSSLLQWRQPIYIAGDFAGIVALAVMLSQPLLVGGYLPELAARRGRRVHRVLGAIVLLQVVVHVAGLWLANPPDTTHST